MKMYELEILELDDEIILRQHDESSIVITLEQIDLVIEGLKDIKRQVIDGNRQG